MSVELCVWCVCVIVRLSHAGLQATIYIGVFIMLLACMGSRGGVLEAHEDPQGVRRYHERDSSSSRSACWCP